MQARPAPAALAAEPFRAAPEPASVAPALYRAALGPVHTAHYLSAFERLDATGRVLSGWNWAAALCTVGWLVFRGLWWAVPAYLAALAAGVLLLAAGHRWLALPLPMLAGLALAGLLAACGLPGLYGDALMHAEVRRRIDRAVSAAPTLRDAMDLLHRQAGSWRRLAWVAALGGGLALALAAGWAVRGSDAGARRTGGEVVQAVAIPPEPPAPQASSGRIDEVDAPAPLQSPQPQPQPQADGIDAADAAPPQAPVADTPAPAPVQAEPPAPAPAPAPAPVRAAQRRLYLNVGLFADPANARRAHERLRQAGLPSTVQPFERTDGSRLERVRVGPFTSAVQANAAAVRVRALGLEAVAASD